MGIYGTVRPAVINPAKDVDIYYNYTPSRYADDGDTTLFKKLDSTYLETTNDNDGMVLSGLYNLKLPLSIFSKKGFYSIYIKPKEIKARITDVGSLITYGDVRGVIFNTDSLSEFATDNSLVGYRIEYFNQITGERESFSRLITSSNKCEGITQSLTSNANDVVRYRFTTFGSLIFCTVTPSVASTFKPNESPYIGMAGQDVVLVNTKFNPMLIELELVEHDDETISYMLEGEQVHDIDHGIITTFNENGEIYHQSNYKALKDALGNPAFTVKTNRNNIDTTQSINSILGDSINGS